MSSAGSSVPVATTSPVVVALPSSPEIAKPTVGSYKRLDRNAGNRNAICVFPPFVL